MKKLYYPKAQVVEKEKKSVQNVEATVQNHFVDANKMVQIGSEAERSKELYYTTKDYKDWKVEEKVYVIEKYWPHRDFGEGIIKGFEINEPYSSYRIKIELEHPWFDYETFFPPYDIFRIKEREEK